MVHVIKYRCRSTGLRFAGLSRRRSSRRRLSVIMLCIVRSFQGLRLVPITNSAIIIAHRQTCAPHLTAYFNFSSKNPSAVSKGCHSCL